MFSQFIPQFDDVYLEAQDVFYVQFNDIDIYVEDIDQEALYEAIFSKILDYKIGKIFPLGGKKKVIEKALTSVHSRRKIFIVDKDFDDLLKKEVKSENLIYLEQYSIENYLSTEEAFLDFLREELPKLKEIALKSKLRFNDTHLEIVNDLASLCACYFVIQKLGLPIENCGAPLERYLCTKTKCKLDLEKIEELKHQCRVHIEVFGLQKLFEDELSEFFRIVEGSEISRHLPGKYLLTMHLKKIAREFGISRMPARDSVVFRLAKNSSFANLNFVKQRIVQFVNP